MSIRTSPAPGATRVFKTEGGIVAYVIEPVDCDVGLFGDCYKRERHKPIEVIDNGRQAMLFDVDGDPGQMLLFDDGVTPSDLIAPSSDGN